MADLQRAGGGAVGAALPIALRTQVDEPGAPRLRQPSVLAGVGTGVAAGALYLTDAVDTPVPDSFLAGHAVTSVPLGITFAMLPKKANTSTTDQVLGLLRSGISPRRPSGGNGNGNDNGSNGNDNGGGQTESVGRASVTSYGRRPAGG